MRHRSHDGFTTPERIFVWGLPIAGILTILAGTIGWIMNIFKLVGLMGQPMSEVQVELIIRVICAFMILPGAIAGWF